MHRPKKDCPYEPTPKSYRSQCPESSRTPLKRVVVLWMSLSSKQHFSSCPLTLHHPVPHLCSHSNTSGSHCHRWSHLNQVPLTNSSLSLSTFIPPITESCLEWVESDTFKYVKTTIPTPRPPKAYSLDGCEHFPWEWQEVFLMETPAACHIPSPAFRSWELCSFSK